MKRFFILMLGIAMISLLFTGCKNKNNDTDMGVSSKYLETNEMKQRSADTGVIENNVYTSNLLNLKYTAAEDMVLANAESLDKMNQEYKDSLHGMSLDMFCSVTGENESNIRIELMKLENPYAAYDQIMSTVTQCDDSTEKKYSIKKYKLCDVDFTEVSYTESPNSKRLIKRVNEYIVIINIIATDNESIDKLLAGFSKMNEDESQ